MNNSKTFNAYSIQPYRCHQVINPLNEIQSFDCRWQRYNTLDQVDSHILAEHAKNKKKAKTKQNNYSQLVSIAQIQF